MTIPLGAGRDATKDITLYSPSAGVTTSWMIASQAQMQDITPASTRRSDGDSRYSYVPTESFWSQTDWSAGLGVRFPAEPTAYFGGSYDAATGQELEYGVGTYAYVGGDTTRAHRLTSIRRGITAPISTTIYPACYGTLAGVLYGAFQDKSLRHWNGSAWIVDVAAAGLADIPTQLIEFRSRLWVIYGNTATTVTTWDGAALAAPAGVTSMEWAAPYGSMLFYVKQGGAGATQSYRLNRYDPDNTTAVADLAIFPLWVEQRPRGMQALGADLYICFSGSLWKFTSANGNAGLLTGPVDTWAQSQAAGTAITVYQGALVYSIGWQIRRLLPGGKPATLFPLLANDSWGMFGDVVGLTVASDMLFVLTQRRQAWPTAAVATTDALELYAWNGTGMHKYATPESLPTFASATPGRAFLANEGSQRLWVGYKASLSAGSNQTYVTIGDPGTTGTKFVTTLWTSSILDFGLYDVVKTISRFGIVATQAAGNGDPDLTVVVDGTTSYQFVAQGSSSALKTPPIRYYIPPGGAQSISGKLFQLQLTLPVTGDQVNATVVRAIMAIPNPNLPLRNGFHLTIRIGPDVQDYIGRALYVDQAAVTAALAVAMAYRGPDHLTLYWIDGNYYSVRMNTRQLRSYAYQLENGNGRGWELTFDCQEMS